MRPLPTVVWLALAPAVASPFGCRGATEVRVEVTTDLDCASHGGTSITVGQLGEIETKPSASVSTYCDAGRIGAIVIVPSGGAHDEVAVKVVSGVKVDPATCVAPGYGPSCIVARRALRYLPNQQLLVPVTMRASCENLPCQPDQTCVAGTCKSATIADPSQCASAAGCGETGLGDSDGGTTDDGGTTGDGGPPVGIELALGDQHTCARMPDATVRCWGSNASGQLGLGGQTGNVIHPTPVPGLTGVQSICAGSDATCAIMANGGSVQCWGNPSLIGRSGDNTRPGPVPGLTNIGQMSCARYHDCAVTSDGATMSCWGASIGLPAAPAAVSLPTTVAQVANGEEFSLVRLTDGHVRVFGADQYTQLGLGALDGGVDVSMPVELPGVAGVDLVATQGSGGNTSCVRRTTGDVLCWGRNGNGQAGLPGGDLSTPQLVPQLTQVTAFAIGVVTSCVLRADAQMWCMGSVQGFDDATLRPVAGLASLDRVWAGETHFCARAATTGIVSCFGSNDQGQLGDGTMASHDAPSAVAW